MINPLTCSLLLCAALLAGCQAAPSSDNTGVLPRPSAPLTLDAMLGDWTVTAINGEPIPPTDVGNERDGPPTLRIEPDGRVGGFGGVNRWSTAMFIEQPDSGRVRFGPVIATKMAGPPERMDLEQRFFNALAGVTFARVTDQTLELCTREQTRLSLSR